MDVVFGSTETLIWIGSFVVVVLMLLAGSRLVRGFSTGRPAAMEELDRRYSQGEINQEEYLRRRARMEGQPPPGQPGPP